ncbi:E3 ubiquitin-protein ligase RNF14 isoform X2 [Augochlora pura]
MDNEKQKDEIIALESIYNEEEFSHHEENGRHQCSFKIFINLLDDYYITYKDNRHMEESLQKINISHLPPLTLHVILPEDYPSISPPIVTLHSSWLCSQSLAELCKKLDQLWEENKGQEILFTWVGFLHDESLEFLNMQGHIDMSNAYTYYQETLEKTQNVQKTKVIDTIENEHTIDSAKNKVRAEVTAQYWNKKNYMHKGYDKRALNSPIGRNPIQALIDYNDKRNHIEFEKNFYPCKICFLDKMGKHCTKFLPCGHVFCKDCITGYIEARIKDGNVQNICCPEEKCTSEATPAQIKGMLSSEMFAKYDSMLLNSTLDTMMDIIYCPRRNCQYPVSREPDEQMANCPVCRYAFCIFCKMVYHGIEPCKIYSEKRQLVTEYQEASNERKLKMEQRYGKKQLQVLVENTMSENWIQGNSQRCPKCNVHIEKTQGCNKMSCCRCNTYFCWLCSTILNRSSPYEHFRNSDSKCFNMLYHGTADEDEDEDIDEDEDNDFIHLPYDIDEDEYEIII